MTKDVWSLNMTPAQCRAARALLNWTQDQLATAASSGNSTVRNFEAGRSTPKPIHMDAMRSALEAAGVIFIPGNGEGPGVRLRKGAD
ncbi:helix-turn-helix domain-containing protein [Devosia indica]